MNQERFGAPKRGKIISLFFQPLNLRTIKPKFQSVDDFLKTCCDTQNIPFKEEKVMK